MRMPSAEQLLPQQLPALSGCPLAHPPWKVLLLPPHCPPRSLAETPQPKICKNFAIPAPSLHHPPPPKIFKN